MKLSQILRKKALGFVHKEDGANAVEFAIVLPVMLVCFGAIVEGSRIYWNYQGAVSGVRDAARYVARTTDLGVCTSGTGGTLTAGTADAVTIINRNMRDGVATGVLPSGVTVGNISASYSCVNEALKFASTPVATVTATVTIQLPFGTLFELYGIDAGTLTSTIIDQSRIYGI